MLTAKKSEWFEKIFARYNRNLFRRRFHSFKAAGLEILRQRDLQKPLIIYANHSSWWDGLAAFEISRAAELDSFVMMEEKQLQRLFLFRRLGAFSVNRENPRDGFKSIRYAAEKLLEKNGRALWIFPQGEIRPNDARPLKFYNGVSRIIGRLEACDTVSVAFRYEFLGEYKPEIFVRTSGFETIRAEENTQIKKLTEKLEVNLTGNLNELRADISTKKTGKYEKIF